MSLNEEFTNQIETMSLWIIKYQRVIRNIKSCRGVDITSDHFLGRHEDNEKHKESKVIGGRNSIIW